MTVIAIPKILRERLTDEGTDALVGILDKVEERAQQVTLEIAEERFEKRIAQLETKIEKISSEIANSEARLKVELETRIASSEARLRNEISNLGVSLKSEIAETRANLTKWMFVFIMGEFWALLGVLFVFFRK